MKVKQIKEKTEEEEKEMIVEIEDYLKKLSKKLFKAGGNDKLIASVDIDRVLVDIKNLKKTGFNFDR